MSFASDTGYTPSTIATIMSAIMVNYNTQFNTTYTDETFIGTNAYKYFYALAQRVQENEIKTGELFSKIQDYFAYTNEKISRPVGTPPGLLAKLSEIGFTGSIKPPIDADAGKLYVAIDIDTLAAGYAAKKLQINTMLSQSVAAGIVTQGDQVTTLVLTNGQSFDFKFKSPNKITPLLRLTITLSENNQLVVGNPDDVKTRLMSNIAANYRIGKNFEPQRYFTIVDAPWAQTVLLEYKIGAGSWTNAVYDANYDDLFVINLANIEIVEA